MSGAKNLNLSENQHDKLRIYEQLLLRYNKNINLISRDEPGDFWEDHVLHSLQLLHRSFAPDTRIVDWGSGGGLPVIPLAVACPHQTFIAVDSVRKKVQAVRTFARRLGLKNIHVWHGRAGKWQGKIHYSVSRATASLSTLWSWHTRVAIPGDTEADGCWSPGLICLKGGNLSNEIEDLNKAYEGLYVKEIPLNELVNGRTYPNKQIVAVDARIG